MSDRMKIKLKFVFWPRMTHFDDGSECEYMGLTHLHYYNGVYYCCELAAKGARATHESSNDEYQEITAGKMMLDQARKDGVI